MGTRSNIGIVNQDKSITSIYVHWDGYPEWNGRILLNYYNTADNVRELVKLGDLSSLRPKLNPEPGIPHDFQNPQEGVTVAYGRDRGEKDQEAIVYKDLDEFEDSAGNSWVDYQYLFDNGKWSYRNVNKTLSWRELTPEVCK